MTTTISKTERCDPRRVPARGWGSFDARTVAPVHRGGGSETRTPRTTAGLGRIALEALSRSGSESRNASSSSSRTANDASGSHSRSPITSGTGQLAAIQAVTPSLGVELTPVDVRDASGIEHSIAGNTCGSNSGLIVTISPLAFLRRELIIALAARHRLPAVYAIRVFVADGGLMSYGPDEIEQHRRAAGYVDRILRGEKPADLPVQRRPNTNW